MRIYGYNSEGIENSKKFRILLQSQDNRSQVLSRSITFEMDKPTSIDVLKEIIVKKLSEVEE